MPAPSATPILIAVPHAGRSYPAALLERMRFPGSASLKLEDRYVDKIAEELARETGAALLIAHAPRAMIDLNRAIDEMDWGMVAGGVPEGRAVARAGRRARGGLGLIPRRLPDMGELWKRGMELSDLDARIEGVHRPYHSALESALLTIRDRWGAALLIDLHSMPPLGPKHGPEAAADYVFGDRFGASCAGNLCAVSLHHFAEHGRMVAHNRPYAGGYVLDRHSAPARGIHAFQLEICRAAYLDSQLCEPGAGFASVTRVLAGLIRRLAEEVAGLGSNMAGRDLPQAAE